MLNALSKAFAGLQASSRKLESSANNVANLSTPGFRANRGVETAKSGPVEPSNVDLAKEAVAQITAVHAFKANANVIKAVDKMTGTILDIKG